MSALVSLKSRRIGSILLVLYKQGDGTYYVEAENDDFRVWRLTRDREIAKEYYVRFWFWSWCIEAIPGRHFLRIATFMMRK